MNSRLKHLLLLALTITASVPAPVFARNANPAGINISTPAKTISITVPDKRLSLLIDYSRGCVIRELSIKGKNTLSEPGIYTGLSIQQESFSSSSSIQAVKIDQNANSISISGIIYGNQETQVNETWNFRVKGDKILWTISRSYDQRLILEDMALPAWNFRDLSIWKGGILDNGGMVWCKYLKQPNDTYGVHTGGVTFWNSETGHALRISPKTDKNLHIAGKYSNTGNGVFRFTNLITDGELPPRYNLSRFVAGKTDVFAPFEVNKKTIEVTYELQYTDYFKTYSRGKLPGIDAVAVRELMNTTGRYGVVDNNIIGANGWLTNWKCLHEPFFAQIGMALGDQNYTKNMSATLDQERDQAMLPDGRVLSRWHNAPGDEIPGTYNAKTGYYEAMWGYTIDSQTGYVINTAEQFDLNGDLSWLRSHQLSCEKALDWLIKRDENNNGLFEMMNKGIAEKKASDWLDIVWASYENAFVNAQMYEALRLWANCEKLMGNTQKSAYYSAIAGRLKTAFNKSVDQGGFWMPAKKQYVYWRDQDGSAHGDNLVTPVNFAAIAFGLCDQPDRIAMILNQIEQRNAQENLFHWPLCFDSFRQEEVSGGNWPFPKYENGDIFPTWGYLGVRAYALHNKTTALKYISNLLKQYRKDGLSSQRYSRTTQTGLGDDILAGICTGITALYRDLYGLRPKWNRMGLEPNMTTALAGTDFTYQLRGTTYRLQLSPNDYTMSTAGFSVKSKAAFGAGRNGNTLRVYPENQEKIILEIVGVTKRRTDVIMDKADKSGMNWTITSPGNYHLKIKGLNPASSYRLQTGSTVQEIKSGTDGSVSFQRQCKLPVNFQLSGAANRH